MLSGSHPPQEGPVGVTQPSSERSGLKLRFQGILLPIFIIFLASNKQIVCIDGLVGVLQENCLVGYFFWGDLYCLVSLVVVFFLGGMVLPSFLLRIWLRKSYCPVLRGEKFSLGLHHQKNNGCKLKINAK